MLEKNANEYWCPMGRISLQRGSSQPRIDVIPGGAFNIALTFAPNTADHGAARYPSVCIGKQCAMWRRGVLIGHGGCGLTKTSPAWMAIALAVVAVAALALRYYPGW